MLDLTGNDMTVISQIEMCRQKAREIFRESMHRVDIRNVLTHRIKIMEGSLQIGKLSYPLEARRKIVLIGVGKAAVPMCTIITEILRPALRKHQVLEGIAVGTESSESFLPAEIAFHPGSHPVPSAASRAAAVAVCDMLEPLDDQDLVLFLLSGGASSMLEAPIDPSTSVDETAALYEALLHAGLPIVEINTLRKHLSAVKGGRLAKLASPATQLTIIISDVPGEAFDMVGSGLSLPDSSTIMDCHRILDRASVQAALGPAVVSQFLNRPLQETPKPNDAFFSSTAMTCLLSNDHLLDEVRQLAIAAGYHAEIDNSCDDWDYRKASDYLMRKVERLRESHPKVALISGGEVLVKVGGACGQGGRNQQFALYTALHLADAKTYIAALSAGSDGIDGNSPAAGAICDNFTVRNAALQGLEAADALARFDAYPFFAALGDAILTGPTGNNIRDLRLFLSA
jgi:hydroxypyruvate reductase